MEILVVTGIGRVPHKEAEVMPIGLAIGYASAFITGDTVSSESYSFLEEAARPTLEKPVGAREMLDLVEEMLELPA